MNQAAQPDTANRFAFGANWQRFVAQLGEQQVQRAEASICRLLQCGSLAGRKFLDVGSGSGLFSLAARRLGAQVHSFDYDLESVTCTSALRDRFFPHDTGWIVEQGSILDRDYAARLGAFEIVYAWGVLHHTGDLWQAVANTLDRIAPDGVGVLAIYNDQGPASARWKRVKRWYNGLPAGLRGLVLVPAFVRLWGPTLVRDLLQGHPRQTWTKYGEERGMSPWRDVVDWVGGWPFEVARPDQVFEFCQARGMSLVGLKTCGAGLGCNEFVLRRDPTPRVLEA